MVAVTRSVTLFHPITDSSKITGNKDSNYYEAIKEKALERIKFTTHIFLFSVIRITITIKILLTINIRFVIF